MKSAIRFLGISAALLALGACSGSTTVTPANVVTTTVLTAEMAACVVAHDQDPILTIAQECNIPNELLDIAKVLASSSASAKKAAAARCGK